MSDDVIARLATDEMGAENQRLKAELTAIRAAVQLHHDQHGDNRRHLDDPEKFDHSRLLRCPKCRHAWNASDAYGYDHYEEGEHKINCPECEHEFRIVTEVSHSFTSPKFEVEAK